MKKLRVLLVTLVAALASSVAFAAEPAGNSVTVDAGAKKMKYSRMIFGHFIEHFDNQVYGGIYDPKSKFADKDGFRTDVIEALKQIQVPIVRWPGGCFVSSYHWLDGVGKKRYPVWDKTWQVEDPNTFGTDEYVKWCRKVGCEPYICTNAGTGTAEEMSDWVEYCNRTDGKFGAMRAKNGNKQPHDVKYWSIGNENWGAHELGAKTVSEWGPLVAESAKLMLCADKDIKLLAAAVSTRDWILPMLKKAGYLLDYVSIHGYWDFNAITHNILPYMDCMMRTDAPEKDIQKIIGILEEAGFGGGRIKISYDEWNLRGWHHPKHAYWREGHDLEARRKNDIPSSYTMADAIFSACFLNSCMRHADIVDIACFSPIVNTTGALFVHPEGVLKRTTYHVFDMYVNMLEEYVVPTNLTTERLSHGKASTGVLDCTLTSNEDGTRYALAVVNKDPKSSRMLSINFAEMGVKPMSKIEGTVLCGSSPDDYNEVGDENRVVPEERTFEVKDGCIELPAHSLVVLKF